MAAIQRTLQLPHHRYNPAGAAVLEALTEEFAAEERRFRRAQQGFETWPDAQVKAEQGYQAARFRARPETLPM
jgi:hypothetical protein